MMPTLNIRSLPILACALIFGALCLTETDAQSPFDPVSFFGVGPSPTDIAAGDFDNDGDQDLAVCHAGNNTVEIHLNDGAGTMTLASTHPVSGGPLQMHAGDLDGNGTVDLAVLCNTAAVIDVISNAGSAVFMTPIAFACGFDPFDFALEDLDNDGDLDMAVVNHVINNVGALLNQGSLSFSYYATPLFIQGPTAITFGDLDGDGDRDVAITSGPTSRVLLIRNDGANYVPLPYVNTGTFPLDVIIADVTFDRRPDIVTVDVGDDAISVLQNLTSNGGISMAAAASHLVGEAPIRLAPINANNAMGTDLAVNNWNGQHLAVAYNTGTGAFVSPTQHYTGANPLGLIAVDLNGDHADDLVTADFFSQRVSIIMNARPAVPFAGTGEDINLGTGVNAIPSSGVGDYVKLASAGDTIDVFLTSPMGTFVGMQGLIGLQLYYDGFPPIPPLPGVHINQFGFGALIALDTPALFPSGQGLNFVIPNGLEALSIMCQGLILSNQTNNGVLGSSEGYEIRIR